MAVPYEEALRNLQGMFPHLKPELVAATLKDCQYHLERTVESLLSIDSVEILKTEVESVPAPTETGFETFEERRDAMLALQLQRDEDLSASRARSSENKRVQLDPAQKDRIARYDYGAHSENFGSLRFANGP